MEGLLCHACGKEASVMCGRCKTIAYCDAGCHEEHYEAHRTMCIGTVYHTEEKHKSFAEQLYKEGYVVIPLFVDSVSQMHAQFEEALRGFPEYQRTDDGELSKWANTQNKLQLPMYVKGGFGALGNASSFHNPFVRYVRTNAYVALKPMFEALLQLEDGKSKDRKLEQIMDRMRVLNPGASISAETWHRDTTPEDLVEEEDSIFGGWINFDVRKVQEFSAFRGSHRQAPADIPKAGPGFSVLEPAAQRRLSELKTQYQQKPWAELSDMESLSYLMSRLRKEMEQLVATTNGWQERQQLVDNKINSMNRESKRSYYARYIEEYKAGQRRKWEIEIPPGHILIFYQDMIHEVVKKRIPKRGGTASYRLFTAWRLTTASTPLFPVEDILNQMGVPLLKSKQKIAMHPQGSWFGRKEVRLNLQAWSLSTFKGAMLVPRTIQSGRDAGSTYNVVRQFAPSLMVFNIRQSILDSGARVSEEQRQLMEVDDIDLWDVSPFNVQEFEDVYGVNNSSTLPYAAYLAGERSILYPQPI